MDQQLSVIQEVVLVLVQYCEELLDLSIVEEWDSDLLVHHIVCHLEGLHKHLLIEEALVLNVKSLDVDDELIDDTTLLKLLVESIKHSLGVGVERLDDFAFIFELCDDLD